MGKLTTTIFNESCCDGGASSCNEMSAMSCGCDPGMKWVCAQHRSKGERFRLAQDDSSHWYVIPVERSEEWSKWEESGEWDVPEWAVELGGSPTNVTFSDWRNGE